MCVRCLKYCYNYLKAELIELEETSDKKNTGLMVL